MADDFQKCLQKAVAVMRQWPCRNLDIYHHNDADGLASGAILEAAGEREGVEIRRISLERLYPQVLEKLFEAAGKVIVFADFGGYNAPYLAALNRGRNLVLILDHHPAQDVSDPTVFNLDPDLFGLKGDRDVSAATVCYLFARAMQSQNKDLAVLAVLGAIGDRFALEGRLSGENRMALETACEAGALRIQTGAQGEVYEIRRSGGLWQPVEGLVDELDLLGSAGYYEKGPDQGVRLCRLIPQTVPPDPTAAELRTRRESIYAAEIQRLSGGALHALAHLQWFDVQTRFAPMGVKTIGTFCQRIRSAPWVDSQKYLVGFQAVPNRIPGWGPIDLNTVKVSMRVTPDLEKRIAAGQAPGLDQILPPAAQQVGGFADACHSLAAAVTIPPGRQEALTAVLDKLLEEMD